MSSLPYFPLKTDRDIDKKLNNCNVRHSNRNKLAKVSHYPKGEITMRTSVAVDDTQYIGPRNDKGFVAAMDAIANISKKICLYSARGCYKVLTDDPLLERFISGETDVGRSLLQNSISCDKISFHLCYKLDSWILRINVRKAKRIIISTKLVFCPRDGVMTQATHHQV